MNNWNFTGRLGKDSEMRHLPNGDAVLSFSTAVDFGYGEKKGTIWARCSMFGKRAESVAPYLKKGQQVAISGELSTRKWKNSDDVEQTSLEVRVGELTMVGGKPEAQPTARPQAKAEAKNDAFDDDIPY